MLTFGSMKIELQWVISVTTYSVEILDVELKIVDLDVLFLLILKPAESLYLLSLLTA